ncbi:MAG: hypothetical protein J6E46_12510 [Faecalicoccus sp.]|nr:hypothetical protein [Faecalicoccus sp.]
MAKKMYISPLFSGGLVDGGEHTEPYTNSEEIYSPDNPSSLYPDFIGLSTDQILNVMSLSPAQARALDTSKDGAIDLDEYLAAFPETSGSGDPE